VLFKKGDVVQVDYSSPRFIDEWLSGLRPIGQGDIGVVTYDVHSEAPGYHGSVSVHFPMIGTYGMHSSNLRVVQRCSNEGM